MCVSRKNTLTVRCRIRDCCRFRWQELEEWCAADGGTVVYCHHGVRSAHAIAFLEEKGFTSLVNLTGGIDRWSREADPSVPRYW